MMITPPAGLCAAAAIAAQTTEPGGETALPGKRKAVGTVNKMLKIEAGSALDYGNFFEAQLSGQHSAGETETFRHLDPGGVVDRQLRRSVQLNAGEVPLGQTPDAHILEDHGINTDRFNGGENIDQMGKLFFFNQGIQGEKDFALPGMSITDHALQLIAIDVFGLGSRREFLEADINRISTEFHGSEKSFEATCGRKQLDFLWCVDVRHFYLLDRKKKPGKTRPTRYLCTLACDCVRWQAVQSQDYCLGKLHPSVKDLKINS